MSFPRPSLWNANEPARLAARGVALDGLDADLHRFDLAAGGVVRRERGDGIEIAVVARRRHGEDGRGDRALPKGHLEPGETWAEAALREVREETGCRCAIEGAPIPTSYMAGDTPKLVLFFPMRVVEEGVPSDANEVRAVEWLSPAHAFDRLSYATERAIVRRLYFPSVAGELAARWLRGWKRAASAARERLDGAVAELRHELDEHAARPSAGGESERATLALARSSLDEAVRLADGGDELAARRLYRLAQRTALRALAGDARRRALVVERWRSRALATLGGWRRESAVRALTFDGAPPSVEELVAARALLDEHEDEIAHRLRRALRRLAPVPWVLVALFALLWIEARTGWQRPQGAAIAALASSARLALVLGVGVLGAVLSLAASASALDGRIADELPRGREIFLRATLGAAAALVTAIALDGGIVPRLAASSAGLLAAAAAAALADLALTRALRRLEARASE